MVKIKKLNKMEEDKKYPSIEEQHKIHYKIQVSSAIDIGLVFVVILLIVLILTLMSEWVGIIALVISLFLFWKIIKDNPVEIADDLLERGELSWENFHKKKKEKDKEK